MKLTNTSHQVAAGIIDYPVEISKMVHSDREVAKHLATDFALDSGKGISRIIGTGLKAPMVFTSNASKGFANLPRLYGDEVRKEEKVTGIESGLEGAVKVSEFVVWGCGVEKGPKEVKMLILRLVGTWIRSLRWNYRACY